jgi:hypothetical protein
MKKIVKLTERDLTRLVKKVIKEDEEYMMDYEEMLREIESDLDSIEDKLYNFENFLMDDENLDEDEKEQLLDYIGILLQRCHK